MFKLINAKLSQLKANEGQVEGLPKNPRFIRDERFKALKKSIADAPEMMSLREIIAYDNDGEYVVIGGNMRYRALLDLGYKETPVKLLPKTTPIEKLREYVIKDNQAFGQLDWDILANEWDTAELSEWGVEGLGNWQQPSFSSATDLGNGEHGEPQYGVEDASKIPSFDSPQGQDVLPPELQGIDLSPNDLPKIQGTDETAMERIIICFPKERKSELAQLIGLESIDKVVYQLSEILGE